MHFCLKRLYSYVNVFHSKYKRPGKKKNENTNDMLRNFNSLLLVTLIIILRSSVISVTRRHQHRPSCNSCLTFVYVTSAEHHIVHESHAYILIKKKKSVIFLDHSHRSHLKWILFFLIYSTCLILTQFSDCRTLFLTLLIMPM